MIKYEVRTAVWYVYTYVCSWVQSGIVTHAAACMLVLACSSQIVQSGSLPIESHWACIYIPLHSQLVQRAPQYSDFLEPYIYIILSAVGKVTKGALCMVQRNVVCYARKFPGELEMCGV